MGKFINKSYTKAIDSLTKGTIEKVKSLNYVFNTKSPVICDWYNLDKEATTMDEGSGTMYSDIGKSSPARFKLIKEAVFYSQGIQLELSTEYDEDGLSVSAPSISGIVLPNTWIPYAGDHFWLKQAGKEYVYKVNSVDFDTIENGNNVYKFEASIDQTGKTYIDNQITDTCRLVINNVGTSYSAVLKESVYDCIETLDDILITLKNSFIALFYNDSVQTFTYNDKRGKFYDPYMIEFLMRNNILTGSDEYIYVHHEVPVPRTFSIDYIDSIFRAVETKSINLFNLYPYMAIPINNQYSLFSTVSDTYFMVNKPQIECLGLSKFCPISGELISKVKQNFEFDEFSDKSYMNIIIKFMNDSKIDSNIIPLLESMHFEPTVDMYYCLPMIIYALEYSVKKLMS